jgi:hypothetical protein
LARDVPGTRFLTLTCFVALLQITQKSGDLALAEYARVGRALTMYEVGDRAEAIAELEDMSLSLKGYPGEPIQAEFRLWSVGNGTNHWALEALKRCYKRLILGAKKASWCVSLLHLESLHFLLVCRSTCGTSSSFLRRQACPCPS